jgi:predicted SnoaL-like aldol condensation-catalyzing enzyme
MPETPEQLLRRYYDDVWVAGRIEALDELLADDYRDHDPPPGHPPDRAGAIRFAAAFVARLRDPRLTILTLVAADDAAAAHWRLEWTGPDGRPLVMRGADSIAVSHGRISEIHHVERLLESTP